MKQDRYDYAFGFEIWCNQVQMKWWLEKSVVQRNYLFHIHMNINEYSSSTTSNIPETSLKEKLDYICTL